MKKMMVLFLLLILVSCSGGDFKESRTFIGNKVVDVDTLNLGKQVYTEYCMACHGVKGDGNGVAAKGSFPTPRNFKQGLYKFGYVADGGLPTDADFHRIIKNGLKGTAMLTWALSDRQIDAVTQYIKTFAPQVWQNKDGVVGTPIEFTADPFTLARKDYAISRGKEVYHFVANCQTCHRAYIDHTEFDALNKKINGETAVTTFDEDMYKVKLQESEYVYFDSKDRFAQFAPPDFTHHSVRSAQTVEELYKRISSGVTGTGMPAWKGTLEEGDVWAVAYYVRSLMDLNGSPKRKEFMEKIK